MTMTSITFTNGNKSITLTVTGSTEWAGGENSRVYFDLECTGKRSPVHKLYEVVAGTTRDHVIEHDGRTFAFEYGVDANSNTKRSAISEAISELVTAL